MFSSKCVEEETSNALCKCLCKDLQKMEYRTLCERQCMNYAVECYDLGECIIAKMKHWLKNKKITVTFKIPIGLLNQIDKYANDKFYTRTYVIIKALERFLEKREVLRTKRLRIYE